MPSHENVSEYINKVCNQIRWKRVRPVIARELENHIDDQGQSYISGGMEPGEAIEKALIQMGDPMEIGSALDRTHRPKPEWSMLILMAAALLIGLAIRMFVSSVNELGQPLLLGGGCYWRGLYDGCLLFQFFVNWEIPQTYSSLNYFFDTSRFYFITSQ